jgi:hypothetical protein
MHPYVIRRQKTPQEFIKITQKDGYFWQKLLESGSTGGF